MKRMIFVFVVGAAFGAGGLAVGQHAHGGKGVVKPLSQIEITEELASRRPPASSR
jgi:hypothetical protein